MTRDEAIEQMWRLVVRDHGGCDEEGCSLAQFIEDGEVYDAIHSWACSGAGCSEFNDLYDTHENYLLRMVGRSPIEVENE
jgi:hypothetical protein